MASLLLITFLLLQISLFSVSMQDVRTINLDCSSLRHGDKYQIQTEAMVGMNITLCEQDWSREEQNGSYAVAYYPKKGISPPVLDLTAQEIRLEKCANLTLTLTCRQQPTTAHGEPEFILEQVIEFRFSDVGQEGMTAHGLINDRQEEKTTHGSIAAAAVGGLIGVLSVLLLGLAVGYSYRHRVMRLCGESVVRHQSDQQQGDAEAGNGILQQANVLHLVPQIPGQVSNTQGQVTQQLLQHSQDLPDCDHLGLQVGAEGHHLEQSG